MNAFTVAAKCAALGEPRVRWCAQGRYTIGTKEAVSRADPSDGHGFRGQREAKHCP